MSERSTKAVGSAPFDPEDFAATATLLREYCNTHPKAFRAVCSNNLNIILAALDAQAIPPIPYPMSEWQSISSAPRDGTRFWGAVGDNAIAMLWHQKFEAFVSEWHRMTMAKGYTFNDEAVHDHSPTVHEPTHWMPIPEPPDAPTDH